MLQKLVRLTVPLAFVALVGCTTRELYEGTAAWRTNECQTLLEPQRSDCMDRALMSYAQYEKARADSMQD